MPITLRKIISIAFLSLLVLLATYPYATAQDNKSELKVYQKLFELTGIENTYNQMLNIFLSQFQQGFSAGLTEAAKKDENASPEEKERIVQLFEQSMKNYLKKIRNIIAEVMPFDELVNNVYYPVYAQHFTVSEIEELITFYESPIGRKYISVIPTLMQEAVVIINQKYTPVLQQISIKIAEEEMEKIRQELEKLKNK